ncbi:hypothetical protein MTR67_052659 [Solanum verrucosum]|uniref:Uncharacterized protein n=1 Tax=Solanum verrucosum TaxID=315347 RepID=A0AAF0V8C4_SOLVR|nr:hypothetical protein MTR67_052659 [Solanum verrucosum]
MEEGLQALVFKFPHDPINMQEYNDYVLAVAKTVQYLLYNGLQKQFRVFSWTIGFNPKEETSRAFVLISFPNLPPELFANQSLLSIASAVAINSNTVENKSATGARLSIKNTREISINNEGGKTGVLQIDSKSVDNSHSSGNKVGANETLEKKQNENQLSLTTNPTLVHIDDEGQNNPATIVASTIEDGHQLNGTRGDVVLIGKSGHPLVTNTTVDLVLDPVNAKVAADGPQHDARGVETIECLVENMTQQVDNANKKFESDVETNSIPLMNAKSTGGGVELVHESNWAVVTKKKSPSIGIGSPINNTVQQIVDSQTTNSGAREIVPQEVMCFNTFDALTNNFVYEINLSQVNSTNELVISKEKQGATSTLRWIDIADEEKEQVISPYKQKKLSPTTLALCLVVPIGGSSTLSPNKFANLDDEDISEEGEEEEMIDYCFAIAARNANISPRQ